MRLVIISGLSGSGKTVALHTLEDAGYYCVDNLPLGLLPAFVDRMLEMKPRVYDEVTVAVDARSGADDLNRFPELLDAVAAKGVDPRILFLTAEVDTLLKRFSETRRKHPLSQRGLPLIEAIHLERTLLGPVVSAADLVIDTTHLNVHQLRRAIRERLDVGGEGALALLFQSFGYKHGLPTDTDFVFDIRCLPNPHWEAPLRSLTGLDEPVARFLAQQASVEQMYAQIRDFLTAWIPQFEAESRAYLTVSVGCTGGQHRSVYLVERLAEHFRAGRPGVSVRHRELGR